LLKDAGEEAAAGPVFDEGALSMITGSGFSLD
jgi:hypothetical protein